MLKLPLPRISKILGVGPLKLMVDLHQPELLPQSGQLGYEAIRTFGGFGLRIIVGPISVAPYLKTRTFRG